MRRAEETIHFGVVLLQIAQPIASDRWRFVMLRIAAIVFSVCVALDLAATDELRANGSPTPGGANVLEMDVSAEPCTCGQPHDLGWDNRAKMHEDHGDARGCAPPADVNSFGSGLRRKSSLIDERVEAKRASVAVMVEQALVDQRRMLHIKAAELQRWRVADRAQFAQWFGTTDIRARNLIFERITTLLKINSQYSVQNFRRAEKPRPGIYAYVHAADPTRIFLDSAFVKAPLAGPSSKAGTISHEMSHFKIAGGTKDHAYGTTGCRALARHNPALALTNADNFEFYLENAR